MYGCLHYRAELCVRTALRGRYYVYPLQLLSAIAIKRRYYYYYYLYQNRQTASGLQSSATDFRLSSGIFRYLRDNFQHAPSVDMQTPVVTVLLQLMLSQARECVLEKLFIDSSPGGATDPTDDLLQYVDLAQECATVCIVSIIVYYDTQQHKIQCKPPVGSDARLA